MACPGILYRVGDLVARIAVTVRVFIAEDAQNIQKLICCGWHIQSEIIQPLPVDPEIPVTGQIGTKRIDTGKRIQLAVRGSCGNRDVRIFFQKRLQTGGIGFHEVVDGDQLSVLNGGGKIGNGSFHNNVGKVVGSQHKIDSFIPSVRAHDDPFDFNIHFFSNVIQRFHFFYIADIAGLFDHNGLFDRFLYKRISLRIEIGIRLGGSDDL